MHASLILGAMMAIGAAAAPLEQRAVKVVDVLDTVTVTVTAGHIPAATPAATPAAASNNGGGFLESGNSHPSPPVSNPSPSQPDTGDATQNAVLEVTKKWRSKYGLGELSWDSTMVSNANEVGTQGHGVNENHILIPGRAMGQVITPGQSLETTIDQLAFTNAFETAYVAWLCEVSSDPELQASSNGGVSVCDDVQSLLHMEYSDTGHHDILVSSSYSKIACAFVGSGAGNSATYEGLWTCDLA